MSPSSTVHGGQHDTKYVTFQFLMHAAFVADEIGGFMLEPACTQIRKIKFEFGYEPSIRHHTTTPHSLVTQPELQRVNAFASTTERLLLRYYKRVEFFVATIRTRSGVGGARGGATPVYLSLKRIVVVASSMDEIGSMGE